MFPGVVVQVEDVCPAGESFPFIRQSLHRVACAARLLQGLMLDPNKMIPLKKKTHKGPFCTAWFRRLRGCSHMPHLSKWKETESEHAAAVFLQPGASEDWHAALSDGQTRFSRQRSWEAFFFLLNIIDVQHLYMWSLFVLFKLFPVKSWP